jgi:prophage antirepressor-like protein
MSNSILAKFEFQSKQVRIIEINGEPWFIAKDLCEILEVKSTSDALKRLEDFEKRTLSYDEIQVLNDDPSTVRLLAVSESGMYALVLSSRKQQAKSFRLWVTQEVLPSIRKHGKYELPAEEKRSLPESEKLELANKAIDLIFANVPIKPELVAGIKLNATQKLLPELAGVLEESRNLLAVNTAQQYELLTPTEIGERLGLSAIKVNKLLTEKGFQEKNEARKSRKQSAYLPTGKGLEFSDLTLSTGKGSDTTSYQQLRWYSSILSQL